MTQKPSLGRIVIAAGIDPNTNNGATEAPAIITRVWSDDLVNIKVITDGETRAQAKTSVKLYGTPEDYEASAATEPVGCYWPPRV
jgi:hypothetical protein